MNCSAARRAIGAEPNATSAELEEHLRACPACEEYRREMRTLDENIRRALLLELAATGTDSGTAGSEPDRAAGHQAVRTSRRRFALAASVVVALAAGALIWSVFPRASLAADVLAHMVYEPAAWTGTTVVAQSQVAEVLGRSGVEIDELDGDIVYAQTCYVRQRWVPHFVVRTKRGPVTVIVMPDDSVSESERFEENGYSGLLLPAPKGSVAVLTRGNPDPQMPAQEIMRALRWSSRKS